jgi:hypothetical protein
MTKNLMILLWKTDFFKKKDEFFIKNTGKFSERLKTWVNGIPTKNWFHPPDTNFWQVYEQLPWEPWANAILLKEK